MIENLEIRNFKSIKKLNLNCKKVNVFIGKPNAGKSNILESLAIFSFPYVEDFNLKRLIRLENMTNMFYDQDLSEKIEIIAENFRCEVKFENGKFVGSAGKKEGNIFAFSYDYDAKGDLSRLGGSPPFKFYKFEIKNDFPRPESEFLLPPSGDNLLAVLQTNKELRKGVANIFAEFGFRVVFEPQEGKIKIQKEIEDVIIAYPYSLVSDTLQRIIFHLAAIETNKDAIIIFEEPESHSFPFYTKFIAERIALDKTNQYFVTTHNPYFLSAVLEKTPKDDIGIFITYFKDYQTKIRPITKEEMPEIIDLDTNVFFNLDRFLVEK